MDSSQLNRLLQHAEWVSNFDERTLERAADYARRQRVIALELTPRSANTCLLRGHVRGSERHPYQCSIAIEYHERRLTVDSACSCPVGRDCKHAAAMLLAAANLPPEGWPGGASRATAKADKRTRSGTARAPQVSEEFKRKLAAAGTVEEASRLLHAPQATASAEQDLQHWSRWLDELEAPSAAVASKAEAQRRFGILLRRGDNDALLVDPVWLRPGKSRHGALVDPKPLTLHMRSGAQPAPAEGWPPEVAGALALLLQDNHIRIAGQPWTRVQASWQEQALEILLQHYPAYEEKGSRPLQRGPQRALELRWQDQGDGSQRLRAQVEAETSATLLRGAGLWYIASAQGMFGRVEGDPQVLDGVASAPAVQPEQVATLRQELRQRDDATLSIPLPAERGPVEPVVAAPTPILHLRVIEPALRQRHGPRQPTRMGCARLSVDYAGHRLNPDPYSGTPTARVMQGQRVLEIRRDLEAETEFEARLEAADLVEGSFYAFEQSLRRVDLDEHDFLLQPNERRPPLQPEAWRPVIDVLADAGFRIEYAPGFPRDELVDIDAWHAEIEPSGNAWFDVSLGIDVDGERVDLLPVLRRVLADPEFPRTPAPGEKDDAVYRVLLDENRSVQIPLQRLRALIEPLMEWLEGDGELRLHRSQAPALRDLADEAQLIWRGGDVLRAQLELLANVKRSVPAPAGFKATLRPYQCEGLAWLDFLAAASLGGILADDMGLGKTVQVLAHILGLKQRGQLEDPALVVAPTSLVGNWKDESARFAPDLDVLVIHGADRADRYEDIVRHDLVITTYPLLPRDRDKLVEARFSLLVLDEAQAIKNARSQAAQVVRELPAARRLAMTGTPLENHLGELWAQFDAVEPGLLGSHRQFTKLYRTPIEKHADAERQARLNRRVGPLLLRRRKDQVLTDLPAKSEMVRTLELEGDQRSLYETLRLTQHERVRQTIKERGLSQAGIIVLDALLKLRQACCDPRLVKLPSARKVQTSTKLEALLELIDGLLAEDRRILLFSQFTEMLGLIESALTDRGIAHQVLTGQTPGSVRGERVRNFQEGTVPVFLISLKAGGVGLNLTAADTVIHYDPWWNPAVEAQATDRAHRIGQDKPVFVYKLIASGTVEEKIQAMQARKSDLARAVLEGGATQRLRFDEADLAELFAPL